MKIILSIFTGLLFLSSVLHAEEKQDLVVYTYDSFNSDWGPGPKIEKAFENICDCDVKFVTAGDGAALLAKLRLEGNKTKAKYPQSKGIKVSSFHTIGRSKSIVRL